MQFLCSSHTDVEEQDGPGKGHYHGTANQASINTCNKESQAKVISGLLCYVLQMHSECNGWFPILTSKLFCAEITEPVSYRAVVHCRVNGAVCFSAYGVYLSPVSKKWYTEALNRLGAGAVCRVVAFGTTTSGCMQSHSCNLELTILTTTTLPPQCWPGVERT